MSSMMWDDPSCLTLTFLASPPLHFLMHSSQTKYGHTDNINQYASKIIVRWCTFSRSSGSGTDFPSAMAAMSWATLVISLDRVLSVPQSVVSRYSSQLSNSVCLSDLCTQRLYGAMLRC